MKASYFKKAFPFTLFLAIPSLSAQNVILFDDMTGSAYSASNFNSSDSGSNPDDISTAFGNIATSGGNPDSVLNITHEHDIQRDEFGDPFGDGFTNVQSFFENSSLSHNPATQGFIQSVTFSLDIRTSEPIETLFFTINDSNGGAVANAGAGFISLIPDGQWQTITLSGVTEAGASGRDFSGSDALSFGFGFTSFAEVSTGQEAFAIQADNFQIDIDVIPEPSSALLIAFGFVGLFRRQR
ncbi:MAG: PEP-CTERM sorting domain-containing protein [Roseibacillus sp.]